MSDIDDSLRQAPVIDKDGYAYLIHPLTDGIPAARPGLLIEWAEWAADQEMLAQATVMLAPEAMALPLAAAVSLKVGLPYLVVRKRRYDLAGETVAYCETGYGESCLYVNGVGPGDRVVIIEDVVSTGGTLTALIDTLQGMGVEVVGTLAFIDKAGGAGKAATHTGTPVVAMRSVRVDSGRVVIESQAEG